MRTRSQSRRRRQQQVTPTFVEPFDLEKPNNNQEPPNPPVVTMADNRTMAEMLQAPTEGYEDAIVVPAITADNFELKHSLLTLTKNLRNEITRFQQRFDESFYEAWDRFNKLLRACPHHGFSELHQLDTFYNALNSNDQDSLNSAAGVSTSSSTPGISPDVAELKDMVKALLLDKKNQSQAPATVKVVEESCVTCGGAHSYRNCLATDGNVYRDNIQEYMSQAAVVNYNQGNTGYRPSMVANQVRPPGFPPAPAPQAHGSLPSNTIANPKGDVKAITIRSGVFYNGPQIPPSISSLPKEMENEPEHQPNASIHLERTNLPALTKTRMILELADRTISTLTGIAEDVFVKVGTFFFPADFVVVDYVADPRVPLILGRPFLRTARALIDVHGEQMTLRHDDQSVTFKVGDTKTFSYNIIESVNRVDVIDIACEEYVQEVLEISESGNPTSTSDLMIDSRSPSFTPFGGSDFLMEEIDEFLEHDDSIPPGVIYDSEVASMILREIVFTLRSC
ncbi:reverse transcriptase domain-containing protein [Tanacetum coccineum]